MTTLVADIGGTHIRLAIIVDGALRGIEKHTAADHESLLHALQAYCIAHDTPPAGRLLIATAARAHEDGVWRFTNRNRWTIDPAALMEAGWHIDTLVNDFAASAQGAMLSDDLAVLRDGPGVPGAPRAILGPGTGLGLALALPRNGGWQIQETFGGHMAAAAVTSEQAEIIRLVRGIRGGESVVVPEDLASGRSLPVLYQAACLFNGRLPRHQDNLLDNAGDADVAQALRLFHEFLGLFAHTVCVAAHAFGGLYLDGGLVQRLYDGGLFDFDAFTASLAPPVIPVVRDALNAIPIWLVRDQFVALRGLVAMQKEVFTTEGTEEERRR